MVRDTGCEDVGIAEEGMSWRKEDGETIGQAMIYEEGKGVCSLQCSVFGCFDLRCGSIAGINVISQVGGVEATESVNLQDSSWLRSEMKG
jgi:hypothetical protein